MTICSHDRNKPLIIKQRTGLVASVITIKKYNNRRLYDTKQSAYVTLEDVAGLIKNGSRVKVVDANSGDDVTALILTQIIMNKAKEDNALLPVSLLHLVIQYGENLLHEFFDKYLEKTIENYLVYRKRMDDQMNAYLEMTMGFSNMAEKTFKTIDPMNLFSESGKKDKKN